MSSSNYSYTADQTIPVPDASEMRFGIITTEWNNHITDKLLDGAVSELKKNGVAEGNIKVERVPGSFELIYAASQLAKFGHVNGIIILGCVIRCVVVVCLPCPVTTAVPSVLFESKGGNMTSRRTESPGERNKRLRVS